LSEQVNMLANSDLGERYQNQGSTRI